MSTGTSRLVSAPTLVGQLSAATLQAASCKLSVVGRYVEHVDSSIITHNDYNI